MQSTAVGLMPAGSLRRIRSRVRQHRAPGLIQEAVSSSVWLKKVLATLRPPCPIQNWRVRFPLSLATEGGVGRVGGVGPAWEGVRGLRGLY